MDFEVDIRPQPEETVEPWLHRDAPYGDPNLAPFTEKLAYYASYIHAREKPFAWTGEWKNFFADYTYYGLHLNSRRWEFRERAPNAVSMELVGEFNGWRADGSFALKRYGSPHDDGYWEGSWPPWAMHHTQLYHLVVRWNEGNAIREGERIPSYATRVVRDPVTGKLEAQIWQPPQPYQWRNPSIPWMCRSLNIYEAHVGVAQERAGIGTYDEFRERIIPRIVSAGYNILLLMGVMEHLDYASLGRQVGNFFAPSSRFGTPEELKALVDEAHANHLCVVMDLVHSHAAENDRESLTCFDGTHTQYFREEPLGRQQSLKSRFFDYGKREVLQFLLSNCHYWVNEFNFDGFRFADVTSMLYRHRGQGVFFASDAQCLDGTIDSDALTYLGLANSLLHNHRFVPLHTKYSDFRRPPILTIAEDHSGLPGLAECLADDGVGFDFRLATEEPDAIFSIFEDRGKLSMEGLWRALTGRHLSEKKINFVDGCEQAFVGGLMQMLEPSAGNDMIQGFRNPALDKAVALFKLIHLATMATGEGYLNFMGGEFAHPEWLDIPNEGSGQSFDHARRLWHLLNADELLFKRLGNFDTTMQKVISHTHYRYGPRSSESHRQDAPRLILADNARKVLFFEKGYYFFFNFNPEQSFSDISVTVNPGEYKSVLNTDEECFGGHVRIGVNRNYPVEEKVVKKEIVRRISINLPSLSGLVIRHIDPPPDPRPGSGSRVSWR